MQVPEHLTSLVDNLPNEPGVYRLRDHQGRPLYVGKSRTLRDRVRTYFRPEPSDRKVARLRARTRSIEFLVLTRPGPRGLRGPSAGIGAEPLVGRPLLDTGSHGGVTFRGGTSSPDKTGTALDIENESHYYYSSRTEN